MLKAMPKSSKGASMRRPSKLILLPACALAIAATAASVAIAAGDDKTANERHGRGALRLNLELPPPGEHLSALAKKLGVSTNELRDALKATLGDPPPRPPADRQALDQHCKDMTDALAEKLGKSGAEVRAAIKSVIEDDIEAAVAAKRLTRAQADRMLARIDAAGCLPPPPVGLMFRGRCGPPGAGHPEAGARRNGDAGFVEPAPAPAFSGAPAGAI
jgi:hypothetical protein